MQGDPILSYDPSHHSCDISEAVWGITGRTFDGVDDKIVVADALSTLTDEFTVIIWAYIDPADAKLDAQIAYIFDTGGYSTNGFVIYWEDRGGASGLNRINCAAVFVTSGAVGFGSGDNAITTAGWYMITLKHNKNSGSVIRVDGVDKGTGAYTEAVVTPTGTPYLAAKNNNTTYLKTIIGELIVFSRELTDPEDESIRLATKGKYL